MDERARALVKHPYEVQVERENEPGTWLTVAMCPDERCARECFEWLTRHVLRAYKGQVARYVKVLDAADNWGGAVQLVEPPHRTAQSVAAALAGRRCPSCGGPVEVVPARQLSPLIYGEETYEVRIRCKARCSEETV